MKNINITILLIFITFGLTSKAQNLDKKGRELKTHLFNYEKGRQYISMMPRYGGFIAPVDNSYSHGIGLSVGYGFFPVKNWSIETNLTYLHYFNKPHDDFNDFNISIQNKYFFLPRYKRVSIYVGLNFTANMFQYKATDPVFIFYDDSYDNQSHTHFVPTITPHAGLSIKVGKVFTIPIGFGYNINFQPDGRSQYLPLYSNLALHYNFGLLKDKKKPKETKY